MSLNRRLPPVRADQFSMVPRPDVPRSTFRTQHTVKATYDAGYLYPILCDEVLPGDTYRGRATLFARMATPIFPVMDNLYAETFFFFVPNRIVWDNWVKFMGEKRNPGDSTSFIIPTISSELGGFTGNSIYDHFDLPINGTQVLPGGIVEINALPLRAYNLIYNEWFRDQNLQDSLQVPTGDGPDNQSLYTLKFRNKRHDYFTSCLPWPTKNNELPNILIGGTAPIVGLGAPNNVSVGAFGANWYDTAGNQLNTGADTSTGVIGINMGAGPGGVLDQRPLVWADLSSATGATVNSLRLAVATQQLLERDARGGTRYTEVLRNHFGVTPQDARLQRPEYIGGGKMNLKTQAIPQTSGTPNDPETGYTATPIGSLGGATTGIDQHSFSYSATEHGFIIGLIQFSADVTYQQGLHRMWSRRFREDYYWPSFAFLGEQAVLQQELWCAGSATTDEQVFGYQERWAEYRHRPSRIRGQFRSNYAGSLDSWHLSQYFVNQPLLSEIFLSDQPPVARVLAAGSTAARQQFLLDSVWNIDCTRALPIRSVPGLTRF